MKPLEIIRSFTAIIILTWAGIVAATPTLIVSNGILMGAENVNVDGSLYDVTFVTGNCRMVFNNCTQSSFAFSSEWTALAAAHALLDQVLLDGAQGNFDSSPNTVFGCKNASSCSSFIPYQEIAPSLLMLVYATNNAPSIFFRPDTTTVTAYGQTQNPDDYNSNYAVFRIAANTTVPEPDSIALLGLALTGLTAMRRSRS